MHARLGLVVSAVVATVVLAACGSEKKEKFTAFEVADQASLRTEETAEIGQGCTRLVRNLGTFDDEGDCKTHIANYPQASGRSYECWKEKKSPSCT
jgi:hypothetical protein